MPFNYSYNWSYYPLTTQQQITTSNSVSGNLSVKIYPYWFKQMTVEWSIPSSWGSCRFNVYKSPVKEDSFVKLNETPLSSITNYFKDTTTSDFSKFRTTWYIVEAVLADGRRVQSDAITWENRRSSWVELRAQEIQRREWFLLSHYTGVDSFVLRRRTYGKRCSNCWNYDLEKVVIEHCGVCMGTSFEGGYFPAIQTYLQYDPSPESQSYEYFGKFEPNEIVAWTISVPKVSNRDLVYRVPDGSLYVITDLNKTELQTSTVRQILKLTHLSVESPEYKVLTTHDLLPVAYQT